MLETFRNWWENSKYFFNNAFQARWCMYGWKAALKWILKEIKHHGYGIDQVEDIIKKELGEK